MAPLCIIALLFFTSLLFAQSPSSGDDYQPLLFQEGKDVVWVPTEYKLAEKMLNLAQVTSKDYVIDLGSGDGRIVIEAAKRGANALGIEYNPDLVALSRRNALKEGVADKAQFIQGDIFESDFSKATVLTMFLLPELNFRLRPIILEMKPGVRVASNSFDMGDWFPDAKVSITEEEGCTEFFCEAFFWVVPAKIEGVWKMPKGRVVFRQRYQNFKGELKDGADKKPVKDGLLVGNMISFRIGDATYKGMVDGKRMQGSFTKKGKDYKWHAARIGGIPE
ncbi:MAG: class I SAM-dependent methyltransferase [Deltaproteobacteria bacterium]|nr:class I SAM-dependent methyltransferase [Deltaproteobacteria bacterium]